MTNKEIEESEKMSCSISDDGEQGFIFDETAEKLFARIQFFETGHTLSTKEKKEILEKTIKNIFETIAKEEELRKQNSWNTRCKAFEEAYQYEKKEKNQIKWLMMNILGLTQEEADRRWGIAKDLMNHHDFKDKEDIVMNRVYLNQSHLKDSGL